jgi:hypothetical protein
MSFLSNEGKLTRFGDVARVADWIVSRKPKGQTPRTPPAGEASIAAGGPVPASASASATTTASVSPSPGLTEPTQPPPAGPATDEPATEPPPLSTETN